MYFVFLLLHVKKPKKQNCPWSPLYGRSSEDTTQTDIGLAGKENDKGMKKYRRNKVLVYGLSELIG